MAIYSYTGLKNNKEFVHGKVEAASIREARIKIRDLGFIPTQIEEENAVAKEVKNINKNSRIKIGLQDKINFTSTLQILTQSGIPIIEALLFIENDAAKANVRRMAQELRSQIMNGGTFADTIAKYPEQFGQVYIGLCKAGEDTGELEITLQRLLELLNKQAAIKSKVIGMMVYPVFVVCLAVIITLIMLMFVFPVFKEMYDSMDKDLPLITAIMMDIGVFLRAHWYVVPVGIFGTIILIMFLLKWKPSRYKLDELLLKIPVLSKMVMFSEFSNFMSVMQVSYDAGIPIVECLYLAILTLGNHEIYSHVSGATTKVQQGQHLSMALKSTGIMPKMLLFMVATGEQSGRLGDMLIQAVSFVDKKLDEIVDIMTKLIEPIMLVVIGSIVLVLALALYLPMFGSYMM